MRGYDGPLDGTNGATNTYTYTWMCSSQHGIHATTTGYRVIAGAFQTAEGY